MTRRFARFTCAPYAEGCIGEFSQEGPVHLLTGSLLEGRAVPTGEKLSPDEITGWLPPVDPPNIIAIGANYIEHCKECDSVQPPKLPLVFLKSTNTLAAHEESICLPSEYPDEVDYEAELAVVIGRRACRVSEADAMDYVFGYTCANDVSARDVQLRIDSQWARGKSFDTFCPVGPFLTTGIRNVDDLHIRLYLNGECMQDQPAADMIFRIPRLIAHLSAGMTLLPGTLLLTGTPAGVGMARKPPRFLRKGDKVEVEIDQIGRLSNRVA